MMSRGMMISLIGVYVLICIVALFEKNYPRALYFFSAGLISVAVLWGMP